MLRVNSSNVLVVPPFECAWLSDEALQLKNGTGCISFEVKGENDVTLILKRHAGSKRWQHFAVGGAQQAAVPAANQLRVQQGPWQRPPVDEGYTLILGSHRNSCLKIEKNGVLVHRAENVPGCHLKPNSFTPFWIEYHAGTFTIGTGRPGAGPRHCWTDAAPVEGLRHVGLSTWDRHVAYRQIQMQPPLQRAAPARTAEAYTDFEMPDACLLQGSSTAAHPAPEESPEQAAAPPCGVPSLREVCVARIRACLAPGNVCSVLHAVEVLAGAVEELRAPCLECLATHLPQVVAEDGPQFCALSLGCLLELLRGPDVACCSEASLFRALVVWTHARADCAATQTGNTPSLPSAAVADVELLLPHIRFPQMTQDELLEVACHPLAQQSAVLAELIAEAKASQNEVENLSPNSQVQMPKTPVSVEGKRHLKAMADVDTNRAARFQRRHSPACRELMYLSDGDGNGVCRYLGTSYGRQEWVNPVLANRLQVRASSPSCRNTDPKAVVSGLFLRNNFAGPRYEDGQLQSWWLVDLGPGHRLIINYYTLRHDGSQDFLRNWVLEGSNDGLAWTSLRQHVDDRTIRMPGQYASWPVAGAGASHPYSQLRIRLISPRAGPAGSSRNLCLSFIELYGYLFQPANLH